MLNPDLVFDSVRRGYNALEHSSNEDIIRYFDELDPDAMLGHVNNIKGILFEQVYVDQLAEQGIQAEVFDLTNHPGTDVFVLEDGEIAYELQMKATDSVSYINSALLENPDIAIVATSEVATVVASDMVINSGIENTVLEETVAETLFEEVVNPVSGLSILGLIFGLF